MLAVLACQPESSTFATGSGKDEGVEVKGALLARMVPLGNVRVIVVASPSARWGSFQAPR